ncbi:hypothetical protein [Streptomyces sp. HPF1205]|uniref:hypothetical protein n=1 Tax=Streptomyces sp. HPF1205 TaxID=2873262 RepID=UPI001CED1A53|nr:hypothetical protein [Streptomyces sp. HPF1205]
MKFRLAELPDPGLSEIVSSFWDIAEAMAMMAGALQETPEEIQAVLWLGFVRCATSSGIGVSY